MDWLKEHKQVILRTSFFATIIAATIISMTSLWLNRTFFKPDTLGAITSTALQQESSRDSISALVVENIFEDKPVLLATAGPRLQPVISGLLDTDIASNAVESAVERFRVAVTTEDKPPIAINLTPIKDTIVEVQSVIGRTDEERKVDAKNIPDEVVLIDTNNLPDVFSISIVVLWLGPISALFVVGGLTYWVHRGHKYALLKRIRISGYLLLTAASITLLAGPLIEPLVVRIARKAESQTLLGNIYDGMLAPFNQQAAVLGVCALLIIALSLVAPSVSRNISKK